MHTTPIPEYLAFGKISSVDTNQRENKTTASYELLGQKVLELELKPGNVEIREFHENKMYAIAAGSELQQACLKHYAVAPVGNNPNMSRLAAAVSTLGNIHFQSPPADKKRPLLLYYPAACLMNIRVPLGADNLYQAMDFYQSGDNAKLVQACYASRLLLRYPGRFEPEIRNIDIMELIVPLAYVYDRIQLLNRFGVISQHKMYRAVVQDVSEGVKNKSLSFPGTSRDEYMRYELQLKNVYTK